jgi:hypothetical protein
VKYIIIAVLLIYFSLGVYVNFNGIDIGNYTSWNLVLLLSNSAGFVFMVYVVFRRCFKLAITKRGK